MYIGDICGLITEFSELISGQPSSAGAVYIRWGKRSCPSSAKLVYRGIAAGTFWTSPGGGTNYQCLAEDPEYGTKISQSIRSYIGGVIYKFHGSQGVKQQSLHDSLVPCVACEADRRQSKIMIPGKIDSSTSQYVKSYKIRSQHRSKLIKSDNGNTAFIGWCDDYMSCCGTELCCGLVF